MAGRSWSNLWVDALPQRFSDHGKRNRVPVVNEERPSKGNYGDGSSLPFADHGCVLLARDEQ